MNNEEFRNQSPIIQSLIAQGPKPAGAKGVAQDISHADLVENLCHIALDFVPNGRDKSLREIYKAAYRTQDKPDVPSTREMNIYKSLEILVSHIVSEAFAKNSRLNYTNTIKGVLGNFTSYEGNLKTVDFDGFPDYLRGCLEKQVQQKYGTDLATLTGSGKSVATL